MSERIPQLMSYVEQHLDCLYETTTYAKVERAVGMLLETSLINAMKVAEARLSSFPRNHLKQNVAEVMLMNSPPIPSISLPMTIRAGWTRKSP